MTPVQTPQDLRRFAHLHAGDLWQSDVMHGPACRDGRRRRKTYMIVMIDDATRIVPWSAFAFSEGINDFLPVFRQALLRRCVPRKLYCDNGSAYRSRRLDLVCARLGIALIHARPYHAAGKGKCERYLRSVRQRFLPNLDPADTDSLDTLNRRLAAWVEGEYHHSPHRGLGGMTPADKVDVNLVGQKVALRFDPAAPPTRPILVVADGENVGQAWPLNLDANSRVKRERAISFSSITSGSGQD